MMDENTLARIAISLFSNSGDKLWPTGELTLEQAVQLVLPESGEGKLMKATESAVAEMNRLGIIPITPQSHWWPSSMDDLVYPPVDLYAMGHPDLLLGDDVISIVGARAATGYGEHVTMELGVGLVDRGHTVVSGGAYGIDSMAHRSVVASEGKTIAVLANGLDRLHPSGNDALLRRISEVGLLLSELPPGLPPTKYRFLQRNRIIAALGRVTVVVEAGWRSGSLNTATHARALQRPIGAFPGPVTSVTSAGCHRIIRDGWATLVTNTEEVLDLIVP
jgi:DNA processing protein